MLWQHIWFQYLRTVLTLFFLESMGGRNLITYATKCERKLINGKTVTYYTVTTDNLKIAGVNAPEHKEGIWAFGSSYTTEL